MEMIQVAYGRQKEGNRFHVGTHSKDKSREAMLYSNYTGNTATKWENDQEKHACQSSVENLPSIKSGLVISR